MQSLEPETDIGPKLIPGFGAEAGLYLCLGIGQDAGRVLYSIGSECLTLYFGKVISGDEMKKDILNYFRKPRLKAGQVIVGNLCQTRDAHFSRKVHMATECWMIVSHVCGTEYDLVQGEDYNKILESLYSDRYIYIPSKREWFSTPCSFQLRGYSFSDYVYLLLEWVLW